MSWELYTLIACLIFQAATLADLKIWQCLIRKHNLRDNPPKWFGSGFYLAWKYRHHPTP